MGPRIDKPNRRRRIVTFVRRYPQVHLGLTLLGNSLFVVGSVLFLVQGGGLVPSLMWVAGSSGMWLGTTGEIVRVVEQRRLERVGVDPWADPV